MSEAQVEREPVESDGGSLAEAFDELTSRLQAGAAIDPEELERLYPRHAEELRQLLPALAALGELSRSRAGAPGDGSAEIGLASGMLGDYRILREVGRGGMGVVYEAEQISLGRRVALKVLPFAATMDERQLQRFKNEARAAASLDHPHIVKVHAVGCERGVHFFAMQFIDGQTVEAAIRELRNGVKAEPASARTPPTQAEGTSDQPAPPTADGAAKSPSPPAAQTAAGPRAQTTTQTTQRGCEFYRRAAEWGSQAAEALEHAHSLGIVHRDVKPGNLMLDGQGRLWVADFGLARTAADSGLTMTGDLLGTLRYMSPEQALAQHGLVDHRTDVYGLGATLYEVLTGRPAVDGKDREEILRRLAFEEPAPLRQLEPSVPDDLETVVLKSLAKEPAERYATAQELADDLRRYLRHEPIRAKKPTWLQRASKWSRRHPAVVRSIMFMLLLLTAGSLLSTWLIWQERVRTEQALAGEVTERKRANAETRIAQQREAETNAVLEFVERKVFAAARPEGQAGGLGRKVTLRKALEAALPYVARNFADQPLIEARLRRTLGLSFRYLGDENIAAGQFEAARTLYAKHRGPDHPDTLASMNNLANSYHALGRLDDALRLREETLGLRKARLGPDHPDTLGSMNNLATSYDALGRHADALRLREKTLSLRKAKLGADHPETLASMNNLAISYRILGRYAEAIKLLEEALPLMKAKVGRGHPRTLACMHNLADSYHAVDSDGEARKLYEAVLTLAKDELGENNAKTLLVTNNLAWLLATADNVTFRDPARAVELAAKAARLSPNSPDFSLTLGIARYRAGDWKQAGVDLERALRLRGLDDRGNANASYFLAMTRWQLGDRAGARQWFDKVTAWMDRVKISDGKLRRFRAEAAHVLGITEDKRPDQATPR